MKYFVKKRRNTDKKTKSDSKSAKKCVFRIPPVCMHVYAELNHKEVFMKQIIRKNHGKKFFSLILSRKNCRKFPINKEKAMITTKWLSLKNKRFKPAKVKFSNKKMLKTLAQDNKKTSKLGQKFKKSRAFLNSKGQGLIEYLILVALMGVATIAIIRTLNQTVKSRFANSIYALQGRPQKAKTHNLKKEEYQRSDLSNFMTGSASTDKKQRSKK